eukprot:TRINITY_DN4110_c0_g1_i6.p1 TRINITY_DN4110_c0_g1~~TRINITY_DN4110_c0_g1_i6.p1  ORF type:complete len:540 (+),score=139.76 TRINITY_DN4110_c0_g1_i6:194-1813(+)
MRANATVSSSSLENARFSMHSTGRETENNPLQSPTGDRASWYRDRQLTDPVKMFHRAASQVSSPDFKPDFKRMAELICEGVNVDAQDSTSGKSALHLVAETGSIDAARFLIGARCDVNLTDHNGDTALHLAATHDEAAMVAILIEEGAQLQLSNKKGWTPIQTAITDSFKFNQSVDSVKVMVGQGADLLAVEDKPGGLSPTELAKRKNNDYLVTYIEQRLHGVRNPERSLGTRLSDARYVLIFWVLFVCVNELLVLLLMRPDGLDWWCCVHYLLILMTALAHMMSWCFDPGYLKSGERTQPEASEKLNVDNDDPCSSTLRWCPTCDVGKPRRSKHCTICRLCVSRFDHHCPWINNCVGERNHRVFVVFVSSLMLLLLYLGVCCFIAFGVDNASGGLPTLQLPFSVPGDQDQGEVLARKVLSRVVHRWITLVVGLVLFLMGTRVGWLWWEQVVRIGQNLTTYEENSSWRFPYLSQPRGEASLKNDFDMGCAQNCGAFWNCCACTGVGNKGEDITYYMYKLIDNVKKLRGADEPAALGSVV